MALIHNAHADKHLLEQDAVNTFLAAPNEDSFARLFNVFSPQVVAFFKARRCEAACEDLAQDVMLIVYRNAGQVRDRALFRAWLFTIARNTLNRYWSRRSREVRTVDITEVAERLTATDNLAAGSTGFEFHRWASMLEPPEQEALTLRFIDQYEYHEIAIAQKVPIGTAQWRVFNAKRKLTPHLKRIDINTTQLAA